VFPDEFAADALRGDGVARFQAAERLLEGTVGDARGQPDAAFARCGGNGEPPAIDRLVVARLLQNKGIVLSGDPACIARFENVSADVARFIMRRQQLQPGHAYSPSAAAWGKHTPAAMMTKRAPAVGFYSKAKS